MKFITYIDNRFQEAEIALQERFSIVRDGEAQACQKVLAFYRFIFTWIQVPRVLIGFVLVNVGLKRAPNAALTKAMAEGFKQKQAMMRKVGMEQKKVTVPLQ